MTPLAGKDHPEMTYAVSGGTPNSAHSLTLQVGGVA